MSVTTPSLPSSWAEVPLSAIAVVNPRGSNTELPDETVVSFLPMKAVAEETGSFDLGASRPVSEVRKGYTQFQDGDILIAKITPCMENGKAAVVSGLRHGIGYGSTEFHVVRLLSPEFDRRFYFHYIVQSGFRREARRHMTGSAGQLRVPSAYLAEVPVPVPPLPEQRRIVAKIEELFTRLDAGVAALQAVKQQIKRYRQAVLRDAFTGELTREWREGGGNADGDAEHVLEEIGKRRRGWLEAEMSRGNSEAKRLVSKLRRETRDTPACYAIQTPRFQRELGNAGIGTGVKHLRVGDVETLALPVAPLAEQKRIVAEIDRHFSLADAAEKAVDESLAKAEHLRQSILRQAFEGRLVPQDPNDEPAEKLLARIRAEKSRIRAGTASPWC